MCNSNVDNLRGTVMIFDARPMLNAYANTIKGGGFEDCGAGKGYPNCQLKFCNIENIHCVRESYEGLCRIAHYPIGKELDTKS